jgi:methyltransferase-like protein
VYVADSQSGVEPAAMAKLRDKLGETFDHVRMEQYLDFVRGRPFRRTVLCHAAAKPTPEPVADGIHQLTVRARVAPAEASAEDAARGPGVTSFQTPEGVKVTTNNPLVIAILTALMDATPAVVPFNDLRRRVSERFAASGTPDVDDETLASALLACTRGAFIEFRVLPSSLVVQPGQRPKASTLARWQAIYSEEVTTLGHSSHKLSGIERFLIAQVDGAKDRAHLVRLTEHAFASGDLKLDGYVPTRESLTEIVDEVLTRLARSGLLVA